MLAEKMGVLGFETSALDGFEDDPFAVVGGEGTHLAKYTSPGTDLRLRGDSRKIERKPPRGNFRDPYPATHKWEEVRVKVG